MGTILVVAEIQKGAIQYKHALSHEWEMGTGATVLRPTGPRYERQPVACGQVGKLYNEHKALVDANDKKALGTGSIEVVVNSHK